MRVLIVEDDRRLGAVLRRGLDREGFGVDVVGDGAAALAAVLTTDFDVVVLDVMLPGSLDGFEVCAELRGRRVRTPILMLTALDAVEERVRGLDVGADDYLVKPFALSELLARLRALSRRHLDDRSAILRAGALELDTVRRRVSVAGMAVGLTMKEFSILELLLLHPGQLISRTQIEEHVWNYDFAGESNLVEVYIGRLRRKLAAVGMGNPIETVRHGGYRLEARAPSATPSGAPESA
jgi:two-component system OmpR family response regulator